jgi:hypothetical protein
MTLSSELPYRLQLWILILLSICWFLIITRVALNPLLRSYDAVSHTPVGFVFALAISVALVYYFLWPLLAAGLSVRVLFSKALRIHRPYPLFASAMVLGFVPLIMQAGFLVYILWHFFRII